MSPVFALLGSGEFEPWSTEVDRWVLERASGDGRVLILPTAAAPEGDHAFDSWGRMGAEHFAELEVPVEVVPLKTRADADRPDLVRLLDRASVAYFSGGNPAYLAHVLEGTAFWRALRAAIDRGLAYVGCSAGVAHLGEVAPDVTVEELGPEMFARPGLRLFPGWLFGLHWDTLDTYRPGLRDFISGWIPPQARMLAVDERTAAVGDGLHWQVVGAGSVSLLEDGAWAKFASGDAFTAAMLPAGSRRPSSR